ncbi:MAG: phenylacetic acid degradation protein, partial [Thermodesulfobacteriota bacterium]
MKNQGDQRELNEAITSEAIKAFFRKDLFAGFVGIELIEAGDGRARARLEIRDHHLNGLGLV